MGTITISKNGAAYLSKSFFSTLSVDKLKIIPVSRYEFEIVFEHRKLNKVFSNERGHYVYASKKLINGKYLINGNEGRHSIR
jgi:hypothetical protein